MDYAKDIVPYLRTNATLDSGIANLFSFWTESLADVDIGGATKAFLRATTESENMMRPNSYVAHCLLVSRRCEEVGKLLMSDMGLEGSLQFTPSQLGFMGLVEDFVYLVGGNSSNNLNGKDSNPYHEILTDIQLRHMGLTRLADGMALHFVSQEILKYEHEQGRFSQVAVPSRPNLVLDVLTAIDALCTTDYLPALRAHATVDDAFNYRVGDIIQRRKDLNHPLVRGLSNGGRERLRVLVKRLDDLENGGYQKNQLENIYSLGDNKS